MRMAIAAILPLVLMIGPGVLSAAPGDGRDLEIGLALAQKEGIDPGLTPDAYYELAVEHESAGDGAKAYACYALASAGFAEAHPLRRHALEGILRLRGNVEAPTKLAVAPTKRVEPTSTGPDSSSPSPTPALAIAVPDKRAWSRLRLGGSVTFAGVPTAPDVADGATAGGLLSGGIVIAHVGIPLTQGLSARVGGGLLWHNIQTDTGCVGGDMFSTIGKNCVGSKMKGPIIGGGLEYTYGLGRTPFGVMVGAGTNYLFSSEHEINDLESYRESKTDVAGFIPYVETMFRVAGGNLLFGVGFRGDIALTSPTDSDVEGDWGFFNFSGLMEVAYGF